MPDSLLVMPLSDDTAAGRLYATPAADGGWLVQVELPDEGVETYRCADWGRVERLRLRLRVRVARRRTASAAA